MSAETTAAATSTGAATAAAADGTASTAAARTRAAEVAVAVGRGVVVRAWRRVGVVTRRRSVRISTRRIISRTHACASEGASRVTYRATVARATGSYAAAAVAGS